MISNMQLCGETKADTKDGICGYIATGIMLAYLDTYDHEVLAYGYKEVKEGTKTKKYNIVHYGLDKRLFDDSYREVYLSTSNIIGSIYAVDRV